MERCSPLEMRKNLEAVEEFRKAGIDFVPVPVTSEEHKKELVNQASNAMFALIDAVES